MRARCNVSREEMILMRVIAAKIMRLENAHFSFLIDAIERVEFSIFR